MKRQTIFSLKSFACLFLGSVASLWATDVGLPACGTATLATYESTYTFPSGGCAIGILDYYTFNYHNIQNAPNASDILLKLSSIGPGFSFTRADGTPFTAAAGQTVQFEIDYNILIDPAPIITGAKLGMDPPFGDVTITEYFCNDSIYTFQGLCFGGPLDSLSVDNTNPPSSWTASTTFANPAQKFETVGILFTLNGTNGASGFDGLDSGSTVTITGPEPASAGIVLLGLAALGAGYKLRKQRKPAA